MDIFIYLFPLTILIGLIGIVALVWTITNGQYDDIDAEAYRFINLYDEKNIKNNTNNIQKDKKIVKKKKKKKKKNINNTKYK